VVEVERRTPHAISSSVERAVTKDSTDLDLSLYCVRLDLYSESGSLSMYNLRRRKQRTDRPRPAGGPVACRSVIIIFSRFSAVSESRSSSFNQ